MSHTETALKAAGMWLAVGSILLAGALVFHGPPSPDVAVQMSYIAEGSTRWSVVHWVAAASLSLFALSGLVVLSAGSRLTEDWQTISAWAVLAVGALWTVTTAVAEATVITEAALAGKQEIFEAWWAFAEGKANGFAALALAVAVIAGNDAWSSVRATPVWAASIGAIAGLAGLAGWVLGSWLRFGFGGPIWLISSLIMCLWLCWFGVALSRRDTRAAALVTPAATR